MNNARILLSIVLVVLVTACSKQADEVVAPATTTEPTTICRSNCPEPGNGPTFNADLNK